MEAALSDDFDMPKAVMALHELISTTNIQLSYKRNQVQYTDASEIRKTSKNNASGDL